MTARGGALAVALVLLACLAAGRVEAHAALVASEPAAGAAVPVAPSEIVLRFNEPVSPIDVRVVGRDGAAVAGAGRPVARDRIVRLPLIEPLADGTYVVSYRVTSLDSHPVAASFAFAVGVAADRLVGHEGVVTAPDRPGAAALIACLNRAVHYLALLAAAGMAFFLVLFGPPRIVAGPVRRAVLAASAVGIATSPLLVGLGGVELTGAGLDGLFGHAVWSHAAHASIATSAAVASLGLAGMIAGVIAGTGMAGARLRLAVLSGGGVLAVSSLAFTGHAAHAHPAWLMAPMVLVHAVGAAFWFGALWPLALVLERCPRERAVAVLVRFSRHAVGVVAALAAAGLVLSAVQVGGFAALFTTGYGLILVAKVGAFALLLMLAASNKWRYVPRLARGQESARRSLRTAVRVEFGLAAVVIAAAAGLGSVSPPRAAAEAAQPPHPHVLERPAPVAGAPHRMVLEKDGVTLTMTVGPARTGTNVVDLRFRRGDSAPLAPKEVRVEWSHPGAGIEPLAGDATPVRPGEYRLENVLLIVPGAWTFRIGALIDDFTRIEFETTVPVAPRG